MEAPGPVLMDLVIAVNGPSFNPHEHQGGLQRVTPDEIRFAYVHAIAKTVRDYNEVVAVGQTLAAIMADLAEQINPWGAPHPDLHLRVQGVGLRRRHLLRGSQPT